MVDPNVNKTRFNRIGARIIVVRAQEQSAIGRALLDAWTTTGLGFISWNKIYCLFPYVQFIQRKSYVLWDPSEKLNQVLAAQRSMGLEVLNVALLKDSFDTMTRSRRVGDKYTWTIELDTTGVQAPKRPDSVLESTTFCLVETSSTVPGNTFRVSHYKMGSQRFLTHPVLQHKFSVMNSSDHSRSHYHDKINILFKRLNERTVLELGMINKDTRPAQYDQILAGALTLAGSRDSFNLPETWKFSDDGVIEYLDKAWTALMKAEQKMERMQTA